MASNPRKLLVENHMKMKANVVIISLQGPGGGGVSGSGEERRGCIWLSRGEEGVHLGLKGIGGGASGSQGERRGCIWLSREGGEGEGDASGSQGERRGWGVHLGLKGRGGGASGSQGERRGCF